MQTLNIDIIGILAESIKFAAGLIGAIFAQIF